MLSVVFWKEKDVSGDATVRPDGKITLPLIGDIQAAGLTPEALVESVTAAAKSSSTIRPSRSSSRPSTAGRCSSQVPWANRGRMCWVSMTVVQLIAVAGGLQEFADKKHITIVHADRRPDGVPWSHTFSYEDFENRKNRVGTSS